MGRPATQGVPLRRDGRYIKTPQQHELFINFQHRANAEVSAKDRKILEVVKPVVTRWNSYFNCFERAVTLQSAVNAYCQLHVTNTANADAYAAASGNKEPHAQRWMRSGGLTAADWQTINEYLAILRPLKLATRGPSLRHSLINLTSSLSSSGALSYAC
jgi:hypothetical protein